jgi:hypothetical protein
MSQTKSLSLEQCQSIASFLRTAADRFREFSTMAEKLPANYGLTEQFDLQKKQAEEFATLFESAESAHVIVGEE